MCDLMIFKDTIFEVCVRWFFFCALIWEYLCLVWRWTISHPHKNCIEFPSCNVKILASLKSHIIWYSFCRIANYVFNLALHTSRGSDLGQNMCQHYLIVYALKESYMHSALSFLHTGRYTPHVHYMCGTGTLKLEWHVHCRYNVQVETIDII
jgi:hypothetical protein